MSSENKFQWLCRIMQAIYEMRQAQNKYFAHPCNYNLRVSKQKEIVVDKIVSDAIAKGYVNEVKETNPQQQEIFK